MNNETILYAIGMIDDEAILDTKAHSGAMRQGSRGMRRRLGTLLLAAVLILSLAAVAYAIVKSDWFKSFFESESNRELTPDQQQFLEENSVGIGESVTINGYTVTLEAALCDDWELYLKLRIVAPEGVTLDFPNEDDGTCLFEDVSYHSSSVDPSNVRYRMRGGGWRPLEDGDGKENSPLNVYMALAMLAETTDGESHAQILNLLGVNDIKTLREQASAVWNAHYNDDGASASVLASSLWLSEDSRFVQETIDRLAKTYYASSYRGKMGSEEMNRALQAWLNENTGGLLQEQADNLELDAETDMALATTVYFSAKWINEFQPDRNTTGVFHAADGDRDSTFMHQDHSRAYYWGEKFSAVSQELETCNGGTMWFLLPDEGVTPEELLNDEEAMGFLLTNPARWQPGKNRPLWEKQKALIVHFSLPKFDVMSQTDLVEGLKALGVTDVFDPFAADFTPMTGFKDGGYLSKVDHAVRVAVDEEGVVAAAYTVMQRAGSAMPPDEEVDFTLDRPFVFAIKTTDDLPLFVGIVNQP